MWGRERWRWGKEEVKAGERGWRYGSGEAGTTGDCSSMRIEYILVMQIEFYIGTVCFLTKQLSLEPSWP